MLVTKKNNYVRGDKKGTVNEKKLLEHMRRARRNIKEIIRLNINDSSVLVTLTYKENMQDYDRADTDFKLFIRKLGLPKYIQVKELQERGAIHYHVILFDFRSLKDVEMAWGKGFVYWEPVRNKNDIEALSNYLSKYLSDWTKGQTIAINKRMWSCSRNCLRVLKKEISSETANEIFNSKNKLIIDNHNYIKVVLPNKL